MASSLGWPIRPSFRLHGFGQINLTENDVFKGTSSEKKTSQDYLPALAYFLKIFTLHVFLSNLPSKKSRSNVICPVRVRVTKKIISEIN
jgi:hypothetical protein